MKRIIAVICTLCLLVSIGVIGEYHINHHNALQFAQELKALDGDVENRLIIGADKQIDYLNADGAATGIEGLYVLQFPDTDAAKSAYDYYNNLPYVEYVEYDEKCQNNLCSTEGGYDFTPTCPSTVNSNIDDAIKLIHKVKGDNLPSVKVGVIDTGVAKKSITQNRIVGGYSYIKGYAADGSSDKNGHGTMVAGTIMQNTLSNVGICAYQIFDKDGCGAYSDAVSAMYLAEADGCSVINCSFGFSGSIQSFFSMCNAVDYLTEHGVIVVAAAGNDAGNLADHPSVPACVPNSVCVGALTLDNKCASFSNFGEGVDIYAPGKALTSYTNTGLIIELDFNGTSAASPVVAAICALLKEVEPEITTQDIQSLLTETGAATNEEHMTDSHRLIADAYECVKSLTGQELEYADLQLEQSGTEITFHSDTPGAVVYYSNNLGGNLQRAYEVSTNHWYQATLDEPIYLTSYVIIATAYAPGKAKSRVELLKAPVYNYEYGYLINEANDTQQYNKFSRCEIIDETVMVVPETINGIEVQEIGWYCYMGNQTVETIILPESVQQIDEYAFANCPNLKTVIAPGAKYCGRYAFYNCPQLETVDMPLITEANTAMFKNCGELQTLTCGCLDTICNQAFYGCDKLDVSVYRHAYEVVSYQSANDDTFINLQCSKCGKGMQVGFMEHINTDYPLLDMNNDNIVNAKDLAYIINDYQRS